jgi:hypothetical protein
MGATCGVYVDKTVAIVIVSALLTLGIESRASAHLRDTCQ